MKWKIALLLLTFLLPHTSLTAQKRAKKISFTGYVIDAEGNSVPNAMFFLDDIKILVASNPDGSFKFKVNPGTKKIMVYSLTNGGFELEYNGEASFIFMLNEAVSSPIPGTAMEVDETVNIGYDNAKKEDLTSSVGSVDKKRLETIRYSTIYDMIAGQVPGVSVSGSSIRIRGQSSINASNEPLFVVDGSPVGSVENISPNDVESIDILKGSSTAIYGARGANGVILIKTKSYKK